MNAEGKHYVGHTSDLKERLGRHNNNKVRATKNKGPWMLLYKEEYATKNEAYSRELQIKRYKGGEAFKKLIK
jgi:putative endonuclease